MGPSSGRPRHALIGALLLLSIAAALLAPRLGTAGLWDPHEVRLLESASEPFDLHTLWQAKSLKPRLPVLPLALGIRLFGANEIGGRAPMLFLGLLCLLALYVLGHFLASLRRRNGSRNGILAGLVLLSSPLFFLSVRHASLTLLPMLAQTLALYGLALCAWPQGARRVLEVLAGVLLAGLGLLLGLLCTGSIVGVAGPLCAVALALALAEGPFFPQLLYRGLAAAALILPLRLIFENAALPAAWRLGAALGCLLAAALCLLWGRASRKPDAAPGKKAPAWNVRMFGLAVPCIVAAILLLPSLPSDKQSGYSPFFAGILHWPPSREPQVDSVAKSLGFGLFPWVALLPLSIATLFRSAFTKTSSQPREEKGMPAATAEADTRLARFAALLPLAWFTVTYLFATLHVSLVGELSFPAVPALALLIGAYLGELESNFDAGGAAAGLCAGLGMVMVGHDFFFAPEHYLSSHLSDTLRWPAPLASVGEALTVASVLLGALFGLCIAAQLPLRRRLLAAGIGLNLLIAAVAVHGLSPALSQHLSYRGIYTRYKKLGGGALALYGVQQGSGRIYGQNSVQLYSLPDVMQFLGGRPAERAFVILNASELGAVDREARLRGQRYFVVDDSNAQFLLITNRLLPNEEDLNPLRRFVSDSEPHPQVPLRIAFDDKIELLGYDLPPEVSRGSDLVIRLYYRVLTAVPGNYRIFLHFDGMGTRWNGDHIPLAGKFPTNFWSPGTYVTDEHRSAISRVSQPAGYYQVFTGFWPGGEGARLKISAGAHESDQRVRLGVIRVK